MYFLTITDKFDSAHYLPKYDGRCKNLHGHCWSIEVYFQYEDNAKDGMCEDFVILKKEIKKITDKLDHSLLNETVINPTAENLCKYMFKELKKTGLPVHSIKTWETEKSCCIYKEEE